KVTRDQWWYEIRCKEAATTSITGRERARHLRSERISRLYESERSLLPDPLCVRLQDGLQDQLQPPVPHRLLLLRLLQRERCSGGGGGQHWLLHSLHSLQNLPHR